MTRDIALLNERVDVLRGEMAARSDLSIRLSLLEQRVEDMREGAKAWMMRIWTIVCPILGGAIGALLTWYLHRQ